MVDPGILFHLRISLQHLAIPLGTFLSICQNLRIPSMVYNRGKVPIFTPKSRNLAYRYSFRRMLQIRSIVSPQL